MNTINYMREKTGPATTVRFRWNIMEKLDAEAERLRTSRSEIIRRLVEDGVPYLGRPRPDLLQRIKTIEADLIKLKTRGDNIRRRSPQKIPIKT